MVAGTVLIACRNAAGTLGETLEGLASQAFDEAWEIVLADNGSTDASLAIFKAFAAAHPELTMRVVDASERPGKSHALNMGIAASAGRAILLNDADDVAAPGWLRSNVEALEKADVVGSLSDTRPLNLGWSGEYRQMTPEGVTDLAILRFAPYCHYIGGANLGFRREVFEAIGGFDPELRLSEDLDFCIRAAQAGFRFALASGAVIYYRNRNRLGAIYRQSLDYGLYDVALARKFSGTGLPPEGRWGQFFGEWRRVMRMALGQIRRRNRRNMVLRARLAQKLGFQVGQTMGIFRFRYPPGAA